MVEEYRLFRFTKANGDTGIRAIHVDELKDNPVSDYFATNEGEPKEIGTVQVCGDTQYVDSYFDTTNP